MTGSTEENENANRKDDQAPARGSAGQSNPSQQGANGSSGTVIVNAAHVGYDVITGRFITGHTPYDPRQNLIVPGPPVFRDEVKTPPLPSEFKAGEIIAWRCWRKHPDRPHRRSMHMSTQWRGDKMYGETKYASAGVYAWKSQRDAELYAFHCLVGTLPAGEEEKIHIGTVYLWGEVIEHECGYRGEYARVKEIIQVIGKEDYALAHKQLGYYYGPNPYIPYKLAQQKTKIVTNKANVALMYLGFIGMAISLMLILSLLLPK